MGGGERWQVSGWCLGVGLEKRQRVVLPSTALGPCAICTKQRLGALQPLPYRPTCPGAGGRKRLPALPSGSRATGACAALLPQPPARRCCLPEWLHCAGGHGASAVHCQPEPAAGCCWHCVPGWPAGRCRRAGAPAARLGWCWAAQRASLAAARCWLPPPAVPLGLQAAKQALAARQAARALG